MSHEPHRPAVKNPLALVLTGGRVEAVEWEDALRRYYNAGLQRLTDDSTADPILALGALAACADAAFPRYNGRNNTMRSDDILN